MMFQRPERRQPAQENRFVSGPCGKLATFEANLPILI
jgi:hypothetical protein